MNNRKQTVYDKLDSMKIKYEVTEHPAVYTIAETEKLEIESKGEIVKNLFLRDVKGTRHFLVVLKKDKKVNLKDLQHKLGSTSLKFASEERLYNLLGLEKGAVTPLGILNDTKCEIEVVIDQDIITYHCIGVHPNDNTATIWLAFEDLEKVIKSCGNSITYVKI